MFGARAGTFSSFGSTVRLRATTLWNQTRESQLGTHRKESSLIDYTAPLGGQFKRLTENHYQCANGTFALKTYL